MRACSTCTLPCSEYPIHLHPVERIQFSHFSVSFRSVWCASFPPNFMCGLFEYETSAVRCGAYHLVVWCNRWTCWYFDLFDFSGCRLGFRACCWCGTMRTMCSAVCNVRLETTVPMETTIFEDIWYDNPCWCAIPLLARFVRTLHRHSVQNSRWTWFLQEKFHFLCFRNIVLHIRIATGSYVIILLRCKGGSGVFVLHFIPFREHSFHQALFSDDNGHKQ